LSINLNAAQNTVIDLNGIGPGENITRVYGSIGDGSAGVPVAGGFDCDGDGHPDFAVGHFRASPLGRIESGEVDLILGDGTIGPFYDIANLADNRIMRIVGDVEHENCGSEVWIDDVTGDGLGDLLICRQNYTTGPGLLGSGALTILVGGSAIRAQADSLQFVDLRTSPSAITRVDIHGPGQYDRLGIWVRTGDIDGDTVADILVGADQVDIDGNNNAGACFVIRGGNHLNTNLTADLSNFGSTPLAGQIARINPPLPAVNFHFGATCQVGDLDGNGRAEVMMAAALNRAGAALTPPPPVDASQYQASGGSVDGTLFIAWDDNFTTPPWPVGFTIDLGSAPGSTTAINGAGYHISFGEEIIGGLDFSGDARPDLFVGDLVATPPNTGRTRAGVGHVFYDAAMLKNLSFDMDSPPAHLHITEIWGPVGGAIGADTVAHGDMNADGLGDLVFGNPHDSPLGRLRAGTIVVFFGQSGGWPALVDTDDQTLFADDRFPWALIQGANGQNGGDLGDTLCYSAAFGDIDKDGCTDIITNEMIGNGLLPAAEDTGNLLLISGASLLGKTAKARSNWFYK
jgi:hypothetical protein